MDASEGSGNGIGRTIWTVWGYLTGAVSRYLRPEVTIAENQNVYSETEDSVLRSPSKHVDRRVKETDADKERGEKCSTETKARVKTFLPQDRLQVATAQWEKTDVVNEDNKELIFDIANTQCHDSALPTQKEDVIADDQKNVENEQKQTIGEYIENKAALSDGSLAEYASKGKIDFKRGTTEQNPKGTEDAEQGDGYNEGSNEESDHYSEADGKTCVMKRADSDGIDVTIKSYEQGVQEIKPINNVDWKETEDARTEHARDQKRTEYDQDKESVAIDLLLKLVCSPVDEPDLPKQFGSEKLMEESSENQKHEDVHTPDRDEDIISNNVVDMLETRGTTKQGEHFQGHEERRLIDHVDLAHTDISSTKEACEKRLSFIFDSSHPEPEETPPKLSKQILKENVLCNDLELKTITVGSEGVEQTFNTSEVHVQSSSSEASVLSSPETGNLLHLVAIENCERFVHEIPGEPRKEPETGSLDAVEVHEPPILADELSQKENVVTCSKLELNWTSLNDTLVEESHFEEDIIIPISSVEFGTKQIQTLEENAKRCVELKTDLLVETIKSVIDNEEQAEETKTASKSDIEIFERNIEKEWTAVDTFSGSPNEGKWDSSFVIKRKEPAEEEMPDVKGAKTELSFFSPVEVLNEALDLKDKSERCADQLEIMKPEVGLLGKSESQAIVDSVEEMINQVLKETLEMEFQRPTECLPIYAPLLEKEIEFLGDTVKSLVEMVVEADVSDAVKAQNDESKMFCLKYELSDVEGGLELSEKNPEEKQFQSIDLISDINRPGLKRRFDDMNKDIPKVKDQNSPLLEWTTTDDLKLQRSLLDLSIQKSRIGVKNPLVRPPKYPRKLINKISVEPSLHKPPPCEKLKGGQGNAVSPRSKIGFKLPGMVPELPTLRKTEFGQKLRMDEKAESTHQKEQKFLAKKENPVEPEKASLKPKWTPPRPPGIGSPLMMAELKSKFQTHLKE